MALSVRVSNMNGEIVGEKRGGQHRVLTSDPQGNVIDVRDSSGTQLASYNYWPYGGLRTSTGSIVNPWRYSGAWGAYFDGASYYMRARVFRPDLTRWMTVDPLWSEAGGLLAYVLGGGPNAAIDCKLPATYLRVYYLTVVEPTRTLCYGFGTWDILFIASRFKGKSGWIIQKVEQDNPTMPRVKCDGSANESCYFRTDARPYWEFWYVEKGRILYGVDFKDGTAGVGSPPRHDRWNQNGLNCSCLAGKQEIRGYLGFYPDVPKKCWKTWALSPGIENSGVLLATTTQPPGWYSSKRFLRKLWNIWNCCTKDCRACNDSPGAVYYTPRHVTGGD